MRTVEEIKKLAYTGTELIGEPSETMFWIQMRNIYAMYANKQISGDVAKKYTIKAEQDFNIMRIWERCYEKWSTREVKAERAACAYAKNPTAENKDALLHILMPEIFQMKRNLN